MVNVFDTHSTETCFNFTLFGRTFLLRARKLLLVKALDGLAEPNKKFAGRGVVVIGLTTEEPVKEAEAVQAFLGETQPELRLGWVSKEVAAALLGKEKSIPQILVISGEGVIVTRFRGWSEYVPKLLRESTEKALTNPPARPQPD